MDFVILCLIDFKIQDCTKYIFYHLFIIKMNEKKQLQGLSLALNQITKQSISSYWWTLDFSDCIYELVKEDFGEVFGDEVKIWWKKVQLKDCDFDFDYIENLDEYESDIFEKKIFEYIPDFDKKLEKWWLYYVWLSIWKPQFYNYNDDELSIHLWFDESEVDNIPDELKPIIQDYIDNIRIKSYDGYCSFEPSKIDEVDKSDYCYLYAVLQKEWIFEDVKEAINDAIEDISSNYYELYENPKLYYDWKYYTSKWIKGDKYKLVEVQ